MIVTALLLAEAVLLATAGAFVLRRAWWVDRAPRLGIIAWQALSLSIVLAVVLAGLALVVSASPGSSSLAGLLRACVMAIETLYAAPGGTIASLLGVLLTLAVVVRGLYRGILEFARAWARRRQHHALLAMVGRRHRQPEITLLEHHVPAVYCLAGRPHRIVLTAAADQVLDDAQLAAVLAHERAHLRGRHDLVIGAARALAAAFPGVPAFRHARDEIARLVELRADDAAAAPHQRLTLAEAILELGVRGTFDHPASQPAPLGALAVSETSTAARIRRLISEHRPVGRARTSLALIVSGGLLAMPALLFAIPAMSAGSHCCTLPPPPDAHLSAACSTTRHCDTPPAPPSR